MKSRQTEVPAIAAAKAGFSTATAYQIEADPRLPSNSQSDIDMEASGRNDPMATYDAFISYSHAIDKPIAAALQSVIQRLGKPWYRRRALRVFRDDTSLSATPSLWPTIQDALSQSRFLVLLASPEAASSPWVDDEVQFWTKHKDIETLMVALTDGELTWSKQYGGFLRPVGVPLPPALDGCVRSEPKWVDLRPYRHGANPKDSRFIDAGADFAAAIRGIPKEDLLSEEVRQQRRTLTLAWSAATLLLALTGAAGWQWREADGAKKVAQSQRNLAERNFGIAKSAADHVVFRLAHGLRNVPGMSVELVRQILDTAGTLMDQLADAAPDDLSLQNSRSAMLSEFAITYRRTGDFKRALETAEESLAAARKVVAADPANAEWQTSVAAKLDQVGQMQLAANEQAEALADFEESVAMTRKLAAADTQSVELQYDLSTRLMTLGEARLRAGNRVGAIEALSESLSITEQLVNADPLNPTRRRTLARVSVFLGDALLADRDRQAALEQYEESLQERRELARINRSDVELRSELYESLMKVGDLRVSLGQQPEALAAFEEGVGIMRELFSADQKNLQWRRRLLGSLYKVSTVSDPVRARAVLVEAVSIIEASERANERQLSEVGLVQDIREALADLPPE